MPFIDEASKPGIPDAASVGKPGTSADGRAVVTARSFSFPDFMRNNTRHKVAGTSGCSSDQADGFVRVILAGYDSGTRQHHAGQDRQRGKTPSVH